MQEYKFEDFEIDTSIPIKRHRLGKLLKAKNKKTKEIVDILRINKQKIKPEEKSKFENWKMLIVMLEHFNPEIPIDFMVNILHFHETDKYCYVVHEELGNITIEKILIDLRDRQGNEGFDEETTVQIMYEVLRSLIVIKNFGLAHNGIFAKNIYERNGVIKLGLPNFRDYEHRVYISGQKKPILSMDESLSPKSDLWSFGVLIVDLMKGRLSVADVGNGEIEEVDVKIFPSKEARDILSRLVRVDPKLRMSLKDLQLHPV